jgi:hypothetical protein
MSPLEATIEYAAFEGGFFSQDGYVHRGQHSD